MNEMLNVVTNYAKHNFIDLDSLVIKMVNSKRPKDSNHAINSLYKNLEKEVCAGKCNCGKIHQILGDEVYWKDYIPGECLAKYLNPKKTSFARMILALED